MQPYHPNSPRSAWYTRLGAWLHDLGRREVPVWYGDSSRVVPEFDQVARPRTLFHRISLPFPFYDWIMGFQERLSDNAALKDVPLAGATRVLDVGTGTGFFLRRLVESLDGSAQVTAVDRSTQMLADSSDYLAAHGLLAARITFVQGDCGHLPYADGTFDLYTTTYLFDLLNADECDRALAEMQRVLAPGGQAIVVTMTTEPDDFPQPIRLLLRLANAFYCWGYAGGRWNGVWRFFCAGYAPHCRPIGLGARLARHPALKVIRTRGSLVTAFAVRVFYIVRTAAGEPANQNGRPVSGSPAVAAVQMV